MALNWQDVAQVRFQDTTQAADNIAKSMSSLFDPLQDIIDSQTEDNQNALDSAIAQQQMKATGMSAMASGMNAQANMAEVQRKLDPAYIDMQNAETAAKTQMYAAQTLNYENQAKESEFTNNILRKRFPQYFNQPPVDTTGATDGTLDTTSIQPAPGLVNSTDSDFLNSKIPGMGGMFTDQNNQTNSSFLIEKYASKLNETSTNVGYLDLKENMMQDLKSASVSDANSTKIIDSVFGNFQIEVAKDRSTAIKADNKVNIITASDNFLAYGNIADVVNLTKADFVTAYGDVKGKETYTAMLDKAYVDAASKTGTLAFDPRNPQNPLSPSVTTSRTSATNYVNFRKTIAEYPEDVRTSVTSRYVAENNLNVDEIKTYENALQADQKQIVRNVTSDLSKNDYNMSNLDSDLQSLHGINIDTLTGVHNLAVSKLVEKLSTGKDTQSLASTAKAMRQESYSEVYTDDELKRAEIGIDNFGTRLNAYLDSVLPGATTATKKILLSNIKTRFGFDDINAKLDTRKKTIKAIAGYFDSSKKFSPFSIGSTQALMTTERADKDHPYDGNEGGILEVIADNFIEKALKKAEDENTVNPKKYPKYSSYNLKRIALKAFSDVFTADNEALEDDDWILTKSISIFGDDEIETSGIFANRDLDLTEGTNTKMYQQFIKRYEYLLKNSNSQLENHVKTKVTK